MYDCDRYNTCLDGSILKVGNGFQMLLNVLTSLGQLDRLLFFYLNLIDFYLRFISRSVALFLKLCTGSFDYLRKFFFFLFWPRLS